MDLLGTTHLAAAIVAMFAGAVVLLSRKGTYWHRCCGWLYVGSMGAVIVTALLIYDLFGGFGPFHVAALVALFTVLMGIVPARRRRPKGGWVAIHAYWMSGSYVGLLAAAVSETATRYLDLPFGATVITASLIVSGVGIAVMLGRMPTTLATLGR